VSQGGRPEAGTYVYGGAALAVLVAIALVAFGRWQLGVTVAGAALGVAGVCRGALPERAAGLLRIRRRTSDVLLMLGFAVALVALAALVPTPPT
jgi:hypothetical protein